MNDSLATTVVKAQKKYHSPQTVIGRFVARRTFRSASVWALIFGIYVAAKAIGYVKAYPTVLARQKLAATFSNNIGIKIILGPVHNAATIAGYVTWNTLAVMVIIGSIWAYLLATKMFRGEEEAGRSELLLAGQTTPRRAAVNIMAGLTASLAVFYVIMAVAFTLVGKYHDVNISVASALFFALVVISGVFVFLMVGALASQLMPTRSRAAAVATAIFGISYVLKAIGDVTSAHWALYITPLGWVEKVQPLTNNQPLWLLPIFGLALVLSGLTVYYAGKRDLGASIFADRDTAKPHTRLLNSTIGLALRLTRTTTISWLAAIGVMSIIYGSLTKSVAQAFEQSTNAKNILNKLSHQGHLPGVLAFLGVVFLLQMTVMMCYAASSSSAIRRDEAEGYLDNLLVQPVSRWRWISGRIGLIVGVIILGGIIAGAAAWLGALGQNDGVSFGTYIQAGVNVIPPVLFILGVGIFTFGIKPRLTSFLTYGLIAWSFMIDMLSSGINLNHWIVDTSILNHMAFAPAASPNWSVNLIMIGIALVLSAIGIIGFLKRDLAAE
jgi:ABC-2 type transport system permease protein